MARAFNERFLRNQLQAMRHLPPDTVLPQPEPFEERELLRELLHLPDTVDALEWLWNERSQLCARITLWYGLEQCWNDLRVRHRPLTGGEPGVTEHEALEEWFAALASQELLRATAPRDHVPAATQLRTVLGVLRRGPNPQTLSFPPSHRLILDLWRLPDDTDPVVWLGRERGPLIALQALGDMLEQARPPQTLLVGPALRVLRPNTKLRVQRSARIVVAKVVLGSRGFMVSMQVRLRGAARGRGDDHRVLFAWYGFDQVVDDRGYQYVVQHRELDVGTAFRGWSREHLRLAYYPALPAETRVVSFVANPMTLDPTDHPPRERAQRLPAEDIGELTFQLVLPENWRRPSEGIE